MAYWAPILLVVVTLVLVVVPVAPALHELRRRHDANPLLTSRHDGRIKNLAESFRSRLEPFREEWEACRAKEEIVLRRLDGIEVLLVGREKFDFDSEPKECTDAVMCARAFIPSGRVVDADVCSSGDLHLGKGAVLRAGLGSGDIILEPGSSVLRWLHARGTVYLRRGSTVHNRLSADQSIVLEPECVFQRMHAPVILALEGPQLPSRGCSIPSPVPALERNLNPTAIGSHVPDESQLFAPRPRMRIQGDFVLAAGESLCANVIATGEFHIERGACFFGSAKSYRDTVIEEGATVCGSIACGGTAYLGTNSWLSGPLLAERDVHLSRGSCIGTPDSLTTIAACGAWIRPGCRIHGTIWARVQGRIVS